VEREQLMGTISATVLLTWGCAKATSAECTMAKFSNETAFSTMNTRPWRLRQNTIQSSTRTNARIADLESNFCSERRVLEFEQQPADGIPVAGALDVLSMPLGEINQHDSRRDFGIAWQIEPHLDKDEYAGDDAVRKRGEHGGAQREQQAQQAQQRLRGLVLATK
jgi:hypothetical protein